MRKLINILSKIAVENTELNNPPNLFDYDSRLDLDMDLFYDNEEYDKIFSESNLYDIHIQFIYETIVEDLLNIKYSKKDLSQKQKELYNLRLKNSSPYDDYSHLPKKYYERFHLKESLYAKNHDLTNQIEQFS